MDKMWLFYPFMENAAKSYFYPQIFHNKTFESIANNLYQKSDIARDIGIVLPELFDFFAGMHDGGVMAAAEGFTNLGKAMVGQFA